MVINVVTIILLFLGECSRSI